MKKSILIWTAVIIILITITNIYALDSRLDLTQAKLDFIKNHPVIRLGIDPKFVPFEFIEENGDHTGIAADYLSLISERTDLQEGDI